MTKQEKPIKPLFITTPTIWATITKAITCVHSWKYTTSQCHMQNEKRAPPCIGLPLIVCVLGTWILQLLQPKAQVQPFCILVFLSKKWQNEFTNVQNYLNDLFPFVQAQGIVPTFSVLLNHTLHPNTKQCANKATCLTKLQIFQHPTMRPQPKQTCTINIRYLNNFTYFREG